MIFIPLYHYNDYGVAAYNLGTGNQSLASSYYIIKQMIREGKKICVLSKRKVDTGLIG